MSDREQADQYMRMAFDVAPWKYAKTMPQWPHHYTLKQVWTDPALFIRAARIVLEHGVEEWWHYEWNGRQGKKLRTYYYLDGYKYWIMEPTAEEAVLINRAEV